MTRRGWMAACSTVACLSAADSDIFEAAAAGDDKRVTALLDGNPPLVNAQDRAGLRPLNYAARAGKGSTVMLLTTRGADLNAGKPLLDACAYPDPAAAIDMAMTLAGNNAQVNIEEAGTTALHHAAERGHDAVCWMLVHRGADPNVRNRDGKRPVDIATGLARQMLANASTIERIYPAKRFSSTQSGEAAVLSRAGAVAQATINSFVGVSHGNSAVARQILGQHPEVLLIPASFDELAVEAAAHTGYVDWCRELVDKGSPYSICTAAVLGDIASVKKMVTADPNRLRERGPHDQALLCYTAFGAPQMDIAEFLLRSGSDVNARGLGQTTLQFAARRGHGDLVRLLIDHGADVNAKSWSRIVPGTALEIARRSGKVEIAEMLQSKGAQ